MITLKTLDRTPSLAELKVSYRRGKPKDTSQIAMPFRVASAVSCERYLRQVWNADTIELREEFVVVCLNGSHEVLGWIRLRTGGFNHAQVDIRLLLGVTLQTASTAIVVAHNHPSGNLEPSGEDLRHHPTDRRGVRRGRGAVPRPHHPEPGRLLQLRG